MALNWNVAKVENYKELFDNTDEGRMIEPYSTIVIATMLVGINEITEKNYEKFYNRIHLIESIEGPYFYKDSEPSYITLEDIKRLIGLHTNASNKTKLQFLKNFSRDL